jgi:hypothetical protein
VKILLAACIALPLVALAQTGPRVPPGTVLKNRISHTCKDPNPGNVFREPDGGYHESFQGWFIKAEVHAGSGNPAAYCYYGLDKAAPANRPVYSVHYELPGFTASQCSVSGKTVTCARLPVLKKQ